MQDPTDSVRRIVIVHGAQPSPFLQIPTELIQHIAYFLPTDTDRINFALCSSDLAPKILPAKSHIWRRLFCDAYDGIVARDAVDYKIEYQIRAIILPSSIDFSYGQKKRETYWLELIWDMIMEGLYRSQGADVTGNEESKNFNRIRETVTYLALNPVMSVRCPQDNYDIQVVYACQETGKELIGANSVLSTATALDIRNFWVHHLLDPDEDTFYDCYMNLPEYHRPSAPAPFDRQYDTPKLYLSWLGFESCICPYPPTSSERQSCAGLDGHMVEVEHITLQLDEHSNPENWPGLFEQCVTKFTALANTIRAFFRGTQTYHGSDGARSAPIRGFIERICGTEISDHWNRICFVSYESAYQSEGREGLDLFFSEPWPPMDIDEDFNAIYAYQGVIAPGSSLIVGHWWDPRDDEVTGAKGPFIFWCI